MPISATTHLNFRGNAREALNFYHAVFGGDVAIVTYKDAGNAVAASEANHVLFGQVIARSGFRLMAYDVQADKAWHPGENAVYVVVQADSADEITLYWHKMADASTIIQPLAPSQWSPLSGMLKDRFGITWVLSVVSPYQAP
jgi:PhnB protein